MGVCAVGFVTEAREVKVCVLALSPRHTRDGGLCVGSVTETHARWGLCVFRNTGVDAMYRVARGLQLALAFPSPTGKGSRHPRERGPLTQRTGSLARPAKQGVVLGEKKDAPAPLLLNSGRVLTRVHCISVTVLLYSGEGSKG